MGNFCCYLIFSLLSCTYHVLSSPPRSLSSLYPQAKTVHREPEPEETRRYQHPYVPSAAPHITAASVQSPYNYQGYWHPPKPTYPVYRDQYPAQSRGIFQTIRDWFSPRSADRRYIDSGHLGQAQYDFSPLFRPSSNVGGSYRNPEGSPNDWRPMYRAPSSSKHKGQIKQDGYHYGPYYQQGHYGRDARYPYPPNSIYDTRGNGGIDAENQPDDGSEKEEEIPKYRPKKRKYENDDDDDDNLDGAPTNSIMVVSSKKRSLS